MKWKKNPNGNGILTGCDQNHEWMLPSWFNHYTKHNTLPISFIDFGMSKSARLWCEKKGTVIPFQLSSSILKTKEEIPPITVKFWERICAGNLWESRPAWFSKPFALMQTPYIHSLWIDLDTEIQKDLSPLFSLIQADFAIAPTSLRYKKFSHIVGLHLAEEKTYNTGVILYKHASLVLEKWADKTLHQNGEFLGDENVLNRLLYEEKLPIQELPRLYNWPHFEEENPDAAIIHFLGGAGKQKQLYAIDTFR